MLRRWSKKLWTLKPTSVYGIIFHRSERDSMIGKRQQHKDHSRSCVSEIALVGRSSNVQKVLERRNRDIAVRKG